MLIPGHNIWTFAPFFQFHLTKNASLVPGTTDTKRKMVTGTKRKIPQDGAGPQTKVSPAVAFSMLPVSDVAVLPHRF